MLIRYSAWTVLLLTSPGLAEHYRIALSQPSSFVLEVDKTGLMAGKKHHFEFTDVSGSMTFEKARPEDSKTIITIQTRSALCRDSWVSVKDLRKIQKYAVEEMLNAEKYPEMLFQSISVQRTGEEMFLVSGKLTIRGREAPARVAVTIATLGSESLQLKGTTTVKLSDYRLKPPSAALGTIGTKDEMTVSFDLTAKPVL